MDNAPSLYEIALQQCIKYASFVTDIGGLPYPVVKPFLAKLGHEQLAAIESKCPHIIAESDELWRNIIAREFKDRVLPQKDFRRCFYQYRQDKEAQLGAAKERLKLSQEQWNRNKRAASVVALSETDLPMAQRNGPPQVSFKSRSMQSVARKAQAGSQFRKSPHQPYKYQKVDTLSQKPSRSAQSPMNQDFDAQVYQPQSATQPHQIQAHSHRPIGTRRKRLSSIFIQKR